MSTTARTPSDIVIVHSSDLHIDDAYTARAWGGDGTAPLAAVLKTARAAAADLVLLSGDVFEHNRLPMDVLRRIAGILADARLPVVMLPGNHDPLMPGSVWRRGDLASIDGVHVLGADQEAVHFPDFDLTIWGRPHRDYDDMAPLADPRPRATQWHVAAAHGHFVERKPPDGTPAPSWLISRDEIDAADADYVALGHWNLPRRVGGDRAQAHYSGSPDTAKTVNLARLAGNGNVEVRREPIRDALPA